MVVTVLFAEKTGSRIEERAYNWESGSTEFVADIGRDSRSVPNLIDYQGKITDNASNPITSSVSIAFTIYNAASGGSNLWNETHSSVAPVDGLVHVLLGSVPETPLPENLFDGSDRWLGINVNSDGEMIPRLRIVSVPYAIYANDSDKLDGYDSAYFMTASSDNWVDTTGDTMTGNLVVNADFQATGITLDSGGDAGTSGQVLSSTVTGTEWVEAASGDGHSLDAADGSPTDVVYVDNDGNVGIGSDNPTSRLSIYNEPLGVLLDDRIDWLRLEGNGGNSDNLYLFHRRHMDGTNWNSSEIRIQKQVDASPMHYISFMGLPGNLSRLEFGYSTIPYMSIDKFGKVGIGLSNPEARLHVNYTVARSFAVGGWLDLSSAGGGQGLMGGNSYMSHGDNLFRYSETHATIGAAGVGVNALGGSGGWNSVGIFANEGPSVQDEAFTPNWIAAFRADGNVGIGTTTPSSKLDVVGNVTLPNSVISGNNTGAGYGVYGENSSSSNYTGRYGVYGIHSSSGNYGHLGSLNYGVYAYCCTYYAGYFSGDVHVTGTFTNPSDERFKENVQPFSNALAKIKLMDVHTFNFIQMGEEKQLVLPEGEQIGLIAQELEEILPDLVSENVHAYDKNEGIEGAERDMERIEYKGINYIGLIPVLIEGMKEQQEQIEQQQQQIEVLKQQIAELK